MTRMLDFEDFKREYQVVPVEEYPNNVLEAVPEPMVSVQISTYQHADFIRDCLDGVLTQETNFPVEILIGEDESDDGTREICKEYADRHPDKIRLFLHRRENNIKIHGRPTGKFQSTYTRFKCRGKYIAICEGDDYWTDPQKLQKQVEFLEENEGYVVSHHDARVIDGVGELVKSSKLSDERKRDWSKLELKKASLMLTLSICYRNALDKYPLEYFRVLNGDLFLFSMMGKYGKAKYQPKVQPAAYREHNGGIWSKRKNVYTTLCYGKTMLELCRYNGYLGENEIEEYFFGEALWCYSHLHKLHYDEGNLSKSMRALIVCIYQCIKKGKFRLALGGMREAVGRILG
jgi:glycosyltransferase involved in cell wall biosynthesis